MKLRKILNAIQKWNDEQVYEFCSHFFEVLSKRFINPDPNIYHPDARMIEIAQEKGLFLLPVHYYSPVPSKKEIEEYSPDSYRTDGLYWNEQTQFQFIHKMYESQKDLLNFPIDRPNDYDFYWDNGAFTHSDAAFYYSLIQILKPRKIVEIGAGNSTKLAVQSLTAIQQSVSDTLSVIDPHPSADLLKLSQRHNFSIHNRKLQQVSLDLFEQLGEGDILFYDGSHVSKYGSDANYFLFTIMPLVKKGVYIHIHDIFLPDDMPRNWISDLSIFWNEQYLLHAFLMYNDQFEIIFSSHYMFKNHQSKLDEIFQGPLRYKGNRGGSFWLRRRVE